MNESLVHRHDRQPGSPRLPLGGRILRLALTGLVVATGALGVLAWLGAGSGTAE
jgi:hypothetical protein